MGLKEYSTPASTAEEAVARGVELLDEKVPGWWRVIDLEALDLYDCFNCMLGQLFGHKTENALGSQMFGFPMDEKIAKLNRYQPSGLIKWSDSGFGRGCTLFDISAFEAADIGCNSSPGRYDYDDLKCAWADVIAERRAQEYVDATETNNGSCEDARS